MFLVTFECSIGRKRSSYFFQGNYFVQRCFTLNIIMGRNLYGQEFVNAVVKCLLERWEGFSVFLPPQLCKRNENLKILT